MNRLICFATKKNSSQNNLKTNAEGNIHRAYLAYYNSHHSYMQKLPIPKRATCLEKPVAAVADFQRRHSNQVVKFIRKEENKLFHASYAYL